MIFPLVSILIPNPEPNFCATTVLKNILESIIKKIPRIVSSNLYLQSAGYHRHEKKSQQIVVFMSTNMDTLQNMKIRTLHIHYQRFINLLSLLCPMEKCTNLPNVRDVILSLCIKHRKLQLSCTHSNGVNSSKWISNSPT